MEVKAVSTDFIQTGNAHQGEDRKLKVREKVAVAIGNMTNTFHFQMISMFLLFFYTDVMKVSAGYVAGLFLFARIIDAVVAPVFGIFVDKTNTPWGKYKPYTVILGIPAAIFGWLTFTDFGFTHNAELIYITATYLVYSICIAVAQAPGTAMIPAVTKRVDERVSIGTFSYLLVIIGAMVVTIGAQPLYKGLGGGNDAKGFTLLMGGAALVCILISIFQVLTIKERFVVEPKQAVKKPSFKEMFAAVFTNRAAVVIYIYVFSLNLANGIRSAIMIHYFKYFFHNEALIVTVSAVGVLPMIIGGMLSPMVTKKIGLKNNVLLSAIISVVTMAAVTVIPASSTGVTIFIILSVVGGLFSGFASPAQSAMMPAAMDYTEWKTGMNVNAFMGSFLGFLQTFATAIAGALAAGALAFVGYVPGVEQNSETIFGLKILMGVLPAIIIAFTASVAWFDLTEEKQAQITKDLAERRKNN